MLLSTGTGGGEGGREGGGGRLRLLSIYELVGRMRLVLALLLKTQLGQSIHELLHHTNLHSKLIQCFPSIQSTNLNFLGFRNRGRTKKVGQYKDRDKLLPNGSE